MSHVIEAPEVTGPVVGEGVAAPFPGIDKLRSMHNALSRRLREEKGSDSLWRDVLAFLERARRTGGVLESDEDRAAAQAVLNVWVSTLCREGRETPEAILDEFTDVSAESLSTADCPYPGLQPYTDEMLRTRRFLAVVGPAGCGKTSLIEAGLIPALKNGAEPGSGGWRYLGPMRPGRDALAELVRLARPEQAGVESWVAEQVRKIREAPGHLAVLLGESGDAPAFLVVDPFERCFAVAAAEANSFAAALAAGLRWRAIGSRKSWRWPERKRRSGSGPSSARSAWTTPGRRRSRPMPRAGCSGGRWSRRS
jgi:hypothetical protein